MKRIYFRITRIRFMPSLLHYSIWMLVLLVAATNCSIVVNTTRLSSSRIGLASVQAGEKLYFAGGFGFSDAGASKVVDVFDLKTNQWNGTIFLDQPRGLITALALEPNIYFLGGLDYTNRPFVYSEAIHDFVRPLEEPPTVRTPIQIYTHNNTLVVIGKYSVDFLDLTDLTWDYDAALTAKMSQLYLSVVVAGTGSLFVVGGTDIETESQTQSVYQYHFDSRTITPHENVIQGAILNRAAEGSLDNGVMVACDFGASNLVAYHLQLDRWKELPCPHFVASITLSMETFIFTMEGYYTIDWTNNATDFTPIGDGFTLAHAFVLDGDIYMLKRIESTSVVKLCPIQIPAVPCTDIPLGPMILQFRALTRPHFQALWNSTHVAIIYGANDFETKVIGGTVYSVLPDPADENSTYIFYGASALLKVKVDLDLRSTITTPLTTNMLADLIVGNDFVSLNGKVGVGLDPVNPTTIAPITYNVVKALTLDSLALMSTVSEPQAYRKMDIYNYQNNTLEPLSVEIPEEVFIPYNYQAAAVLDNKIVIWSSNMVAIYDPQFGSWTNMTFDIAQVDVFSNRRSSSVEIPVLTINNTAYLLSTTASFYIFSLDGGNARWNQTAEAQSDNPLSLWQYMSYKDSQIYVATDRGLSAPSFVDVYYYDISSGRWDTRQLPRQQSEVTMAQVGDFLAIFGGDGTMQSLHIPSTIWTVHEDFGNLLRFSSVLQTRQNNMTFLTGGLNRGFFTFSDLVYIFTDDGFIPDPPVTPVFSADPTSGGPSGDTLITDAGIIAAIVVPIAAALIGAGLLAFFLVRRNKKRRGTTVSMSGLGSKYGTWFTPFDQLKFGQQLGQGANGQVFEGTWKNTKVALKVSMTQANAAVIAELELMVKLRPHPNVVQLLGFSIHPETYSIILIIEYCNQGSLDSILFDAKQAIAMEKKTDWLLGIAKGLGHLHANNIVHRDMAARNILVHQNEAKITDFGMSRLVGEQQHGTTKSELGPIRWMAPESLKDKHYSNKSDVWSFGILMYEVIAQSEPHSNADPIEIGRVIRDQGLTPVIPPSCPPELGSLMQQCWQFSPEQRPTIDQVIQTLDSSAV